MNLHDHANRYYKSLCLCDYPVRSKFAHDICAHCGGIIPHWRRHLMVVETSERRANTLLVTLLLILALAVLAILDTKFPQFLDGAFQQIGR